MPKSPTDKKKGTAKHEHLSEIAKAWSFCEKQSKCIEVLYKDKDDEDGQTVLAKVHFRVQVCCISINKGNF